MTRETCNDHILLVGFMGSGKTSVSRRLSAITGLSLIDVDYRIEAIQHRKIPRIFAEEGEEGFRRIETETLAGLKYEGRSIISCGGGIVCNPANRPILESLGTVIFLDVPLEEAIGRISNPTTRPLLSGERRRGDIRGAHAVVSRGGRHHHQVIGQDCLPGRQPMQKGSRTGGAAMSRDRIIHVGTAERARLRHPHRQRGAFRALVDGA